MRRRTYGVTSAYSTGRHAVLSATEASRQCAVASPQHVDPDASTRCALSMWRCSASGWY